MRKTTFLLICYLVVFFSGCAGTNLQHEKPEIGLSSLRLLPPKGMAPRFEIGLHIVNPSRSPLKLKGIFYTVSIKKHKILSGASNDFPEIEPYGEGDVSIIATVNLLEGIFLLKDILTVNQDEYAYEFNAKLDVSGVFSDMIIYEKGVISLANL